MIPVTSLDDPRVEAYRHLADPAAIAARGLFVVEGREVVRQLIEWSAAKAHPFHDALQSILVTPAAGDALQDTFATAASTPPVYVVPQAVMNTLAGFNMHRGCVALAARPPARRLDEAALMGLSRVLVLERVSNPDNIGGLFRSAAAFGVDLVVLGPDCADPLYRKSIRTSMGATLAVPFVFASDWPNTLLRLRSGGVAVVALTPRADAPALAAIAPVPARVAVLVGAEGPGLSDEALLVADYHARIPTTTAVDSLNVATAAAIAFYHLWGATVAHTGLTQP